MEGRTGQGWLRTSIWGYEPGELALLVGAVISSGVISYLLISDYSFLNSNFAAKGEPIAEISDKNNIVKHRPAELPMWNLASLNQSLYNKDQIYTDAKSSVRVKFRNNDVIDIEQNALVVIEEENGEATINLQKGAIVAKNMGAKKPMRLRIGNSKKTTEIFSDNGTALISTSEKGAPKIAMLSGQAKIVTEGNQETTVQQNQQAEIGPSQADIKLEAIPDINILSPRTGETLYLQNPAVNFSWRGGSKESAFKFELARDVEFNDLVTSSETVGSNKSLPINETGNFYWRVGIPNKSTGKWNFSVPGTFNTVAIKVPEPKWPLSEYQFTIDADPEKKDLQTYLDWQDAPGANGYQVVIGLDDQFAKKIYSEDTTQSPVRTPKLLPGKYFWHIRAKYAENIYSDWTDPTGFSIRKLESEPVAAAEPLPSPAPKIVEPVAPVVVGPVLDQEFLLQKKDAFVELKWQEVAAAKSYVIEISRDPAFQQVVRRKDMDRSFYRWLPSGEGRFYWRVKPTLAPTAKTFPVAFSPVNSFVVAFPREPGPPPIVAKAAEPKPIPEATVKWPAPVVTASATELIFQDHNPTVELNWQPVKNAKSYIIQFAKDEQFAENISTQKTTDHLVKQQLAPGEYYARVSVVGAEKQASEWSDPIRLAVLMPTVLESARLRTPAEGQRITFRKIEPDVGFAWDTVDGASAYEVEIARDQNFQKIIGKKELSKSSMTYSLSEGRYYWRVKAKDPKTSQIKLSALGNFEIFRDNSVPKLLMPPAKSTIDFDADETRNLQFMWEKPADVDRSEIVIARDPEFRELVARIAPKTKDSSVDLNIKSDGPYYWFVEGRDVREKVALRSDVRQFEVTTTPVDVPTDLSKTYRLEAGYNPNSTHYVHRSDDGEKRSFTERFSRTYSLGLRGWLTEHFGTDMEFTRKYKHFDIKTEGETQASEKIDYNLYTGTGAVRYRVSLFKNSYPMEFAARVGYYFNQVVTFFRVTKKDVGLQTNNLHNALLGFETTIPLGGAFSTEIKFDYFYLLATSNSPDESTIAVKNSMQYKGSLGLLYQFMRHGILGYGMFYNAEKYKYKDDQYKSGGKIDASTYGMIYSLGWVL